MGAAIDRDRIRRLMGKTMMRALSRIAAERKCRVTDLPVEQALFDEVVLATWATCLADAARQLAPAARGPSPLPAGVSPSQRPTQPPPPEWSAPDEDITPLADGTIYPVELEPEASGPHQPSSEPPGVQRRPGEYRGPPPVPDDVKRNR